MPNLCTAVNDPTNRPAIAIIPARGGSRRIPGKNIKVFAGRPILEYSIETARDSGLFEQIYVSTDDQTTADVALQAGVQVINRTKGLEHDHVGTQAVMQDAVSIVCPSLSGVACCIYPTAPMMTAQDLQRGRRELTPDKAYAMSVGTQPLHDPGQFYWGWVWAFAEDVPLIGPNTVMIPIAPGRCCDINEPADWIRAEKMYRALQGGE